MSFYSIKENFLNANSDLQEIIFLFTTINKNLIWNGKDRKNFDEKIETYRKEFEYLYSKNLFLESEFENITKQYQNFLSL